MSTRFIEAGWDSYRKLVIPSDAGLTQVRETRKAFFAGAAVLFETLMMSLDSGTEETEKDMQKMANLQQELDEFGLEIDLEVLGQGPRH